ncbi:MAG: ABC transporter ATP-binding protein [Acidobacteriota bacterium]|nr:ABC transporter ATP-binding protein [Acidobacteriota bacterium]
MARIVVEFHQVSKSYSIYPKPSSRLKELACLNRRSFHHDFWALRDVNFQITAGETFCIIGENGSGKSTLLQMVAGIMQPSQGTVTVHGRVAALLELGSGFNPEFSGRDNVYLNAAIIGFSRREMDERFRRIEEFAEIGDFIDQPVKTYSSGMSIRLAFSVAIHVEPEILIVDEALAVGDVYFRQRCMRKVYELRQQGVTVLFVSHDTGDVKAIADRVMWLDGGKICELGQPENVVTGYLAAMVKKDSAYQKHLGAGHSGGRSDAALAAPAAGAPNTGQEIVDNIPNIDRRFGDRRAEILGIAVLDALGNPIYMLDPDTTITVRISVRANQAVAKPVVGFMLRNHMGLDFAGTNTAREGLDLAPMQSGEIITLDFHLHLPELYPSSFSFSPAVADGTLLTYTMCDWIDNAIAMQMSVTEKPIYGHLHLPCRIELAGRHLQQTSTQLEPQLG